MATRLVYFPVGGRAAPIRNAFKIAKVDFVDEHVSFEQFREEKEKGTYTFGAVPVVFIGDVQVTQSNAILRWIGKQGGNLYPTDLQEALFVDEVLGVGEDFYGMIGPTVREQDPEKRLAMRKELVEGKLKSYLGGLNKLAERNGSNGYFVGSSGTIADLKINAILNWFASGMLDGIPKDIASEFAALTKFLEVTNKWIADSTA